MGAFTHGAGSYDPGPRCIAHGWGAVLVEPQPAPFANLEKLYANANYSGRVRLLNRVVCDAPPPALPSSSSAASPSCPGAATFWEVEMSNATGNWGSEHSDARCAATQARGTPGPGGTRSAQHTPPRRRA